MFRKSLLPLLLVLTLLVPCAMAEESFRMMDFYNANMSDKLLAKPGDSVLQKGNEYDGDGNQLTDYAHYLALDDHGDLYYIYEDTNYVQLLKNGYAYGYDYASDEPFVVAYVGDTFAAEMEQLRQAIPLALFGDYEHDDQYITGIEHKDGVLTVNLSYPYTIEDDSGCTSTIAIQSMDENTLVIRSDENTQLDQDGKAICANKATFTMNVPYTLDDRVIALQNPADARTVTFVLDPGTKEEYTQTFTVARNMELFLYVPEGYALFDDAACTVAHTPSTTDADGNYAETMITYLKKAE